MTLNSLIALILLYFTECDSFAGLLRHVEVRRIATKLHDGCVYSALARCTFKTEAGSPSLKI